MSSVPPFGRRVRAALAFVALAVSATGFAQRLAPLDPTYNRDVAPILDAKCASCHTAGGLAPFPLDNASDAAEHAAEVVGAVYEGIMPPWMPGGDSPAFVGREHRTLSPEERATLKLWAEAGAPEGPGPRAARPAATVVPSGAGRTLELAMAEPYTPQAAGDDDYRCFLLDPGLAGDAMVTGVDVVPGDPASVHHVILFKIPTSLSARVEALDAASGGRGWTCFGGPAAGGPLEAARTQWLSAWAPGSVTRGAPAGTGTVLEAGTKVVMQVHYNLSHGARPDRTRVRLRYEPAASSSLTPLSTWLTGAPVELPCADRAGAACDRFDATIANVRRYGLASAVLPNVLLELCGRTVAEYAAQDPARVVSSCDRAVTAPLEVRGVAGHMHTRGVAIRVEVVRGGSGARETLLDIPRWDFHWQDVYWLERPVRVSRGDAVRVTCVHGAGEGEDAGRYVLWGEGTGDEMCLGVLQVSAAR